MYFELIYSRYLRNSAQGFCKSSFINFEPLLVNTFIKTFDCIVKRDQNKIGDKFLFFCIVIGMSLAYILACKNVGCKNSEVKKWK
jgi:hypothetical protein